MVTIMLVATNFISTGVVLDHQDVRGGSLEKLTSHLLLRRLQTRHLQMVDTSKSNMSIDDDASKMELDNFEWQPVKKWTRDNG